MAQTQGMPHLVGDGFFHQSLSTSFDLRAVWLQLSTNLQEVHGKAHLGGSQWAIFASHLRGTRPLPAAGEATIFHHQAAGTATEHITHGNVSVKDFTRARIGMVRPDCHTGIRAGVPPNRGVARVQRAPVGIIGLLLDHDGVFETDFLEGLVPLEHAGRRSNRSRPRQNARVGCLLDEAAWVAQAAC